MSDESPGAPAPGATLRFRLFWLAIGYALVASTAYNSLHSQPPVWAFFAGDVFLHVSTYFILAFWFGQLYPGKLRQIGVALAFVGFGAILEYIQAELIPYRRYELKDLIANTAGAGFAWLALRTPAGWTLNLIDAGIARYWSANR
jgi:VanZ family protein